MPRRSQYIKFEGLFSEGVLGVFRIIRGFANLRNLAEVSVPYKMEGGRAGTPGCRASAGRVGEAR